MSRFLLLCSLGILTLGCGDRPVAESVAQVDVAPELEPTTAQPDIILIVADDMGAGDWEVGDERIVTPNLMRLCDEGVRLDRYYTLPLCTPTRAALLTGKSPLPMGMAFSPLRRWETRALPPDLTLLPQHLQQAGYSTALIGKWHLGHREDWMLPNRRGFDYFYGFVTGAIHYYTHRSGNAGLDWQRNGESVTEEGYTTTLFGTDAAGWIAQQDPDRPLFLYLPFSAPHSPTMAPVEFTKPFKEDFPDLPRRRYCGMVSAMDDAIGQVLAAVEARGKADNTLIVFVSDNGGSIRENGSNGPLRGTKGTIFEGAIRTPGVVRWPARLPAGVVHAQLTDVRDWFPTTLSAAGIELPSGLVGRDLVETLASADGSETRAREDLFFHANIASYLGYAMIRWPYKCIVRVRHKTGRTERQLYRLDLDPHEKNNLREEEPEKVAEMEQAIRAWFASELPGETFEMPEECKPTPAPAGWKEPEDWTAPPPVGR